MSKLVTKGTALFLKSLGVAKLKFDAFVNYAKVELVPPTPADIPKIADEMRSLIHSARTGGYKNVTWRQAWSSSLITFDVLCWFYMGVWIGKRQFSDQK